MADLLGRSPAQDIFGIEVDDRGDALSFELPCSLWVEDDCASPAIARGALIMAMDHAMGYAISATRTGGQPATTIDLRVDWTSPLLPGMPALITVDAIAGSGPIYLASISIFQGGSSPCAQGVGRFFSGVFPGRSIGGDVVPDNAEITAPGTGSGLSAFIGMKRVDPDRFIVPKAVRLSGMVRVGAYHGGLVAASADIAAEQRLQDWIADGAAYCATLETEYLRPSFVSNDLHIEAILVRAGRRAAVVEVNVREAGWDSPLVTSSTALWVKRTAA